MLKKQLDWAKENCPVLADWLISNYPDIYEKPQGDTGIAISSFSPQVLINSNTLKKTSIAKMKIQTMSGIYLFVNPNTEAIYVGSAINFSRRIDTHRRAFKMALANPESNTQKLYKSIIDTPDMHIDEMLYVPLALYPNFEMTFFNEHIKLNSNLNENKSIITTILINANQYKIRLVEYSLVKYLNSPLNGARVDFPVNFRTDKVDNLTFDNRCPIDVFTNSGDKLSFNSVLKASEYLGSSTWHISQRVNRDSWIYSTVLDDYFRSQEPNWQGELLPRLVSNRHKDDDVLDIGINHHDLHPDKVYFFQNNDGVFVEAFSYDSVAEAHQNTGISKEKINTSINKRSVLINDVHYYPTKNTLTTGGTKQVVVVNNVTTEAVRFFSVREGAVWMGSTIDESQFSRTHLRGGKSIGLYNIYTAYNYYLNNGTVPPIQSVDPDDYKSYIDNVIMSQPHKIANPTRRRLKGPST
jgi:hypothetical protein